MEGITWQYNGQGSSFPLQWAEGLIPGPGTKIPQATHCAE